METATPSISVILVTRDRPALLVDALSGVTAQRTAPLEVRIADDGEQPVAEVLGGFGLLELCVLPCQVRSVARARNLACRGARGEVLAFLDDDDRWLPDHLAGLAAAFRDPALEVGWRDSVVVRERIDGGRRVDLGRRPLARDWDDDWMRHDDFVPPSAWGVRRELFERLGGFDERYSCSEDWDFLLRAARVTRPRRVAGTTVEVRIRDQGHVSDHTAPGRREALDQLSATHGLPRLEIRTFWDVAGLLESAT